MSDHEHEEIARRLRAEGQASAPPDLLPSVMAEVRAESRRRRRRPRLLSFPQWRPVAAWATAAAALVALGFGISRLDLHTTSSSSASSGSESHAAAVERAAGGSFAPETFTVSRKAAATILGPYLYSHAKLRAASSATAGTQLNISVPAARFGLLSARLRAAERQYNGAATPSNSTTPSSVVVIQLMRAHTR
jgi:hypothetical protein